MANPFTTQLAAAVRARRADLRLSQQDLADMAGVSERFVRFVEQGKQSLRLDTLLALLDTLGLELQLATRTSAAALALVTQPSELPVAQPPSDVPLPSGPPEGNEPGERENQP
ncbi:type II toxin-antitoxin system Y4mF family antitoxin [Arthrobacter globiformis]|uniref:type II toxin-antitoxin system Y4mF family antitoxin n=1 Tax=Arthrobacter globiformis TaxID=1665 RepID=UPI00279308B2|nr:type II toxin-antitoxin system Y4mF family antitoxin [Arthrobacter globiformis]MDQ0616029.1 HTH-type transcriptional regulator/antitoxin HipB [Arthrobacter globiformis]